MQPWNIPDRCRIAHQRTRLAGSSSIAPSARSVAFCASVKPLIPVMLSRSYGRSRRRVRRCSPLWKSHSGQRSCRCHDHPGTNSMLWHLPGLQIDEEWPNKNRQPLLRRRQRATSVIRIGVQDRRDGNLLRRRRISPRGRTRGWGVLQKGWVQHTTVGRGMLHSEINNRADEPMRFIQLWFIPSERRLEPAVQQKRVEREDRTNRCLLLVSN
jgi:hypothetical protein